MGENITLVDPLQIIQEGKTESSPKDDTNKEATISYEPEIIFTPVFVNEDAVYDMSDGEEQFRGSDSDSYSDEEEDPPHEKRIKIKEEDDISITENHPNWNFYEPRSKSHNAKFEKHIQAQPIVVESNEEIEFYKLMVDEEIAELLAEQTNIYARQSIEKARANNQLTVHSRLNTWQPTTKDEIYCFLGILIWMGLDKKPGINEYWKNMDIYRSKAADYMSRNRFELLIRFLHFSNNALCPPNNASYKIQPLLDELNDRFMKYVDIDEKIYLNETVIRTTVSQGSTPKRKIRDFRIKYRTLSMLSGYSYYTKIYANTRKRTDFREILEFVSPILEKGVTLYTDETVTSVALGTTLQSRNTNLVGPIEKETADLPEDLLHSDVSKSELAARERDGIIVLKWELKKNQPKIILSTKHGRETVQVRSNGKRERLKPKAYQEHLQVVENNSIKKIEDHCPTRRGDKWFKKIGMQVLVSQCVYNAYYLMSKAAPKKNYNLTNFRENLCLQLLTKYGVLTQASRHTFLPTSKKISPSSLTHIFTPAGRKGRCVVCQAKEGSAHVKTSSNKCSGCLDKTFMCMDCFFEVHTAVLK